MHARRAGVSDYLQQTLAWDDNQASSVTPHPLLQFARSGTLALASGSVGARRKEQRAGHRPGHPGVPAGLGARQRLRRAGTRRSVIRIRREGVRGTLTKTLGGSFTGTVVKDLESGVDYFVSVKAGDDGNRCSPFTPRLVASASKGNKPFSGLRFELQKIEVATRRVPCSHVSGRPCRRHQPPSLSGARLGALPTATPERGDRLGGPP